MKNELLEKFKKNNFSSLTREEKEKLVIQTIREIQREQGLTELDIELNKGKFGFNEMHNVIFMDLPEDSYTVLTGIIHELRHQYQNEKLKMLSKLRYTRDVYYLDPAEIDAHEYTISEMSKYSDFFNTDDFDIYVLKLNEQFSSKKGQRINRLKSIGYKDDEIAEIAKQIDKYHKESSVISMEDAETGKGDVPVQMAVFNDRLSVQYRLYYNNNISVFFPRNCYEYSWKRYIYN